MHRIRSKLLLKLKQLEDIEPVATPSATTPKISSLSTSYLDDRPASADLSHRRHSMKDNPIDSSDSNIAQVAAAIESGEPLDIDQIQAFERIIKWGIDSMTEDLKGKCTDTENYYPNNLTISNLCEFTVLPTIVYELEYPRSDTVNWSYALEKGVATLGIIAIMNILAEARIYPVVIRTVQMRETMTVTERLREFPLVLNDLIFPFIMEYLLVRSPLSTSILLYNANT